MPAFADITLPALTIAVALVVLLRSKRMRLIIKSVFRWPKATSTIIEVNDGWIDTADPADRLKSAIPTPRSRPDHPRDTPVTTGSDLRSGRPHNGE